MNASAPGKLLLTGAYAVLRGAPAIVCAIDRRAIASRRTTRGSTSRELAVAFAGRGDPPQVDTSALSWCGAKLGLGSSAAAVVAALGYEAIARGGDLASPGVRRSIFERARAAHATAQAGGSGVDIAASVHGGVLRYVIDGAGHASFDATTLPEGVRFDVYWSGTSARTSEMRARVDALEARAPAVFASRMVDLRAAADAASTAADASAWFEALRASAEGLEALGRDADAPIIVPPARGLARAAAEEGGAFTPSGAGGGDVFIRFGLAAPSPRFDGAAAAARFTRIDLHVDLLGVAGEPGLGEPLS